MPTDDTLPDKISEYLAEAFHGLLSAEGPKTLESFEDEALALAARALGLVGGASGERARNFAVLMFAERPADFIPGAYVNVIREVEGTDRMTSEVFDGPAWVQALRVPDYLEETAMRTLVLRSPERTGHRTVYSWPRAMFAELATNAILHKGYSRPGYVGIYVHADRMTFVNHNRPLPPVTIEDLNEQESFDGRGYVNPELKDMFFALGPS